MQPEGGALPYGGGGNDTPCTYTLVPGDSDDEAEVCRGESIQSRVTGNFEELRSASCYQKWRKGTFTIVPENNPWLDFWDCLVIMALLTTALVVPFEVALYEKSPRALIVLGDVLNGIFTFDIVLTFNVAMYTSLPMSKETFTRDPVKIARYYMAWPFSDSLKAGWFWADLVTVIPWDKLHEAYVQSVNAGESGQNVSISVRLVRILRLVRMFRLVRVIKLIKRWHTTAGLSFSWVEISKCFLLTLLCVHWLACGWSAIGLNFGRTWLSRHAQEGGIEVREIPIHSVYNMALYFCTMIITTVGLGDMLPVSQTEILLATITMFFTSVLWAWVLACIVNVITNHDPFACRFNQLSDDLNKLVDSRNCSSHLKVRMRKYLDEAEHVYRMQYQRENISWLSSGLQGDIALESGVGEICDTIWYLRNLHGHILVEIAQQFEAQIYAPNEFINDLFALSVLMKGSCFHKGYVIVPRKVIAEDMILSTQLLRENVFPRTLTFVEVNKLRRNSLMAICQRHPDFSHRIRRAQIKLAIWRAFIYEANIRKAKVSAWEKTFNKVKPRKSLEILFKSEPQVMQALDPGPLGGTRSVEPMGQRRSSSRSSNRSPPPNRSSTPRAASDILLELRMLGRRVDEGVSDIRGRVDRLDARVQAIEKRSSRSRQCRAM